MMKVMLFWYLQAQTFYRTLHQEAVSFARVCENGEKLQWADVGCGVGLMSHIADKKGYVVQSFDLDSDMISWAKFLNKKNPHLLFAVQDVMELDSKFDVLSATSLLSVVPDRAMVLERLLSLLKNEDSKLILIEPTETMDVKNVWKMVGSLKELYYFKMLFVWARARQGKSVDEVIFKDFNNVSHSYVLNDMVRITIIGKQDEQK